MGSPPLWRNLKQLSAQRAQCAQACRESLIMSFPASTMRAIRQGSSRPCLSASCHHLRLPGLHAYSADMKKREKMRNGMWPSFVKGMAAITISPTIMWITSTVR